MSNLSFPALNGVYRRKSSSPYAFGHDIAFDLSTATAGTITILGRKPGASYFELIGEVDIASPSSFQFSGTVFEYEFTLAGVVGTGQIGVTDTVA